MQNTKTVKGAMEMQTTTKIQRYKGFGQLAIRLWKTIPGMHEAVCSTFFKNNGKSDLIAIPCLAGERNPSSPSPYKSLFNSFLALRNIFCQTWRHPDALPIGRAKSSRRTSLGGALFQRPLSRRVQTIQLGLSFWDSSSLLSSAHLCFKSSGQQPAEEWLECTNVMWSCFSYV